VNPLHARPAVLQTSSVVSAPTPSRASGLRKGARFPPTPPKISGAVPWHRQREYPVDGGPVCANVTIQLAKISAESLVIVVFNSAKYPNASLLEALCREPARRLEPVAGDPRSRPFESALGFCRGHEVSSAFIKLASKMGSFRSFGIFCFDSFPSLRSCHGAFPSAKTDNPRAE